MQDQKEEVRDKRARKKRALERGLRTKSNEVFKLLAVSLDQRFLATEKHEHNPTQWAKASFSICFYIQ